MAVKEKKTSSTGKIIFSALIIFFGFTFLSVGYFWTISRGLPSLEQLENYDPDLVTRIFSADGVLLKELYTQRRVFVDLEEIAVDLVNAAVA